MVELEGRRVEHELPGRQGRLLFVFLAANRLRQLSRAELAEAVWADRLPADVDTALSALLSKLRRALGRDALEGRGEVRLVLPNGAWIDLEAASEGLHRAESALARRDWTGAWGPARVTQHVARRGFLPGEDAEWIEETRRQLEALHVRSLEIVSQACLEIGHGELDTGERAARALVQHDPYRESGHRSLMEILAARGNRAQALLVYDALRRRLRDDLGMLPSPATHELYKRLLG